MPLTFAASTSIVAGSVPWKPTGRLSPPSARTSVTFPVAIAVPWGTRKATWVSVHFRTLQFATGPPWGTNFTAPCAAPNPCPLRSPWLPGGPESGARVEIPGVILSPPALFDPSSVPP